MNRLFRVLLICIILTACETTFTSSIPDVRFYFTCSLVQGEYSRLTIPGQFIKKTRNANGVPVGYGGLIIGQSIYSDGYTYVAFDAACPVEVNQQITINLSEDGLGTAVCPKCGTRYDLNNSGYPTNRQDGEYLKHYPVFVSGTTLTVQN